METKEIEEHNLIKEGVIKLLEDAKDTFNTHFGEEKKANVNAFDELENKTRNGRFSIIVVGEFSAGKSTFLNALMHEKYLDSFSSETTANINFLRSVNDSPTGKPMIQINYKDGTIEISDDVSFENIQKYVSTKGVDVASTIDSVEIFLDSPFLNSGVDLVDSPGLNGVKELHADITNSQIKASHAAIFMFRATQPGSKSDFETLIRLKKSCKSIIIVLNRIDEAAKQGEESVEDIVNKLRNNFKTMFPNENIPEIWPISAYKALVARSQKEIEYNDKINHTDEEKQRFLETSLIEPFEKRLMHYITKGEKTKNELLSPVEKVISDVEDTIKDLEVEQEGLNNQITNEELNNQIDAVNSEIHSLKKTIEKKKTDVSNAIYDAFRNARNSITSDTKTYKERKLDSLKDVNDLEELEGNVTQYVAEIKNKYQSVYSDALRMLETEYRSAVKMNVEGSLEIINKQLISVCSDNKLLTKATEIDSSYFNSDFDLSKYDKDIASKQEERKNVLNEQYKLEDANYELEKINNQIRKKEDELKSAKEDYILMKSSIQDPGVRMRKVWIEKEVHTTKRSIFNPHRWFGDTYKSEMKQFLEDVPDYKDHDYYIQQIEALENEYKSNKQDLENKKKELEEKKASCQGSAREVKKFQMEREQIEREIQILREEKDGKLNSAIKKQLIKAKSYVEKIFEDLENNSRASALQSLSEKETELTSLALEILEGEIKEELEVKVKKLHTLKEKMSLEETEKNNRLKDIENALISLKELFDKAVAVRNTIDFETDSIKED